MRLVNINNIKCKIRTFYPYNTIIAEFTGSIFLRKIKTRTFFVVSITMMALSMVLFVIGESKLILYVAIALIGYGNSNVFSMIFSQALLALPDKKMK